ncbi:MAG: hypothetical protein A2Z08_11610 [Deltaproteobacteria bacterium RBG_16_54_11]|nr:MAG: hypothetical protein A2Z08_11610 [Deltaproteobacteria bacterium RBG_16_54_11]
MNLFLNRYLVHLKKHSLFYKKSACQYLKIYNILFVGILGVSNLFFHKRLLNNRIIHRKVAYNQV